MITLYVFGPKFAVPEASPFVMKTEVQLKMAGIAYRTERASPRDAPKGKLPFIRDGERLIGDSTFIRQHLERSRPIDLDRGLGETERAAAWAIERMLEDHLYWAMLHLRWADDVNFAKGPSQFFTGVPAAVRDERRARFVDRIEAQGLGRHSPGEIAELGARSLAALSALLGEKAYLFGEAPGAVDATAFAMVAHVATPFFDAPLARAARGHRNLLAYSARMMARYYPDFPAPDRSTSDEREAASASAR
jgi:glutathione S-transferase